MARTVNLSFNKPVTTLDLKYAGFGKWNMAAGNDEEKKEFTIEPDNYTAWTSVKDGLPEPGTSVIVTALLKSGQRVVRSATYTEFGFSGNGNMHDVLAWIKMPDAYEGE